MLCCYVHLLVTTHARNYQSVGQSEGAYWALFCAEKKIPVCSGEGILSSDIWWESVETAKQVDLASRLCPIYLHPPLTPPPKLTQ